MRKRLVVGLLFFVCVGAFSPESSGDSMAAVERFHYRNCHRS
jgi:hypothetical protein